MLSRILLPDHLVIALESSRYTYAKTMPDSPHYYTLSEDWDSREFFEWAVEEMRKHEEQRYWRDWKHGYLDINGFQYWTMGATVKKTKLINRAPHNYSVVYDRIAHIWDREYQSNDDVEESRYFFKVARPEGSVLDIGCGTGMLVDYAFTQMSPQLYTGIDPSIGMLGEFTAKHPGYKNRLLRTSFEHFETHHRYDTILAMFGVPSYFRDDMDCIAKVNALLAPGGRAFLMYYSEDSAQCYDRFMLGRPPEFTPAPEGAMRDGAYWILTWRKA